MTREIAQEKEGRPPVVSLWSSFMRINMMDFFSSLSSRNLDSDDSRWFKDIFLIISIGYERWVCCWIRWTLFSLLYTVHYTFALPFSPPPLPTRWINIDFYPQIELKKNRKRRKPFKSHPNVYEQNNPLA